MRTAASALLICLAGLSVQGCLGRDLLQSSSTIDPWVPGMPCVSVRIASKESLNITSLRFDLTKGTVPAFAWYLSGTLLLTFFSKAVHRYQHPHSSMKLANCKHQTSKSNRGASCIQGTSLKNLHASFQGSFRKFNTIQSCQDSCRQDLLQHQQCIQQLLSLPRDPMHVLLSHTHPRLNQVLSAGTLMSSYHQAAS